MSELRARRLMRVASEAVATVPQDADPCEAARVLDEEGVGSLVVLDGEDRPVGIVTDRDLTLRVVAAEAEPEEFRVEDVMTSPLVTANADDEVEQVVRLMKSRGIRRVPLLDDGRVVAVVALDDLVQALARDMDALSKETQAKIQSARASGRLERIRRDVDRRLHDAYERLQYTNWVARESLLEQIDQVREGLHRAIASDESEDTH